MITSIKKAAVIGAGTMGAGIAGQLANAGVEVWLLDLASEQGPVNALAERGLKRLENPASPGLMSKQAASKITLGNIRDDLHELADCDWVAEAVVERLDIKLNLYKQLEEVCKADAIITSNTSTIPIKLLTEGMSASMRERFAITHFFNPVRFMRLLELVRGEHTADWVMHTLDDFCDQQLGKGVVHCADTPGFLGNRVGVYAIQCALHTAFEMGLSPSEADALFGRPMGIPKTGVFGLYDLIGIDLMADVAKSLQAILPDGDDFHRFAKPIPLMTQMIANGQTGNKGGQGFFRSGDEQREVMDLASGEYQPYQRLNLPLAERAEREGVSQLFDDSRHGEYAWRVLSNTLCYAAGLIPEVGEDVLPIDDAMKLGYNWVKGPFELLDEIGVSTFAERLRAEGRQVPALIEAAEAQGFYQVIDGRLNRLVAGQMMPIERASGVLRLNELRQGLTAQASNKVASWYIYQQAAVVEFHTKANALDGDAMEILDQAITAAETQGLRGVIVHNDAQHFSCGVNLAAVQGFYRNEDMPGLDKFLDHFQQVVARMRSCSVPVIAAPVGLSIGGGFEVVLHADRVICHANSVLGLVESLVGVVPGGGGCKETLYRQLALQGDVETAAWAAFKQLGYGKTATSPQMASKMALLAEGDSWQMNRDRQFEAALTALDNTEKTASREPIAMAGREVYQAMLDWLAEYQSTGKLLAHDCVVGAQIAAIVTGGDCEPGTVFTEQDLFDAERKAFLNLAATGETRERIDSMLASGSAVRN